MLPILSEGWARSFFWSFGDERPAAKTYFDDLNDMFVGAKQKKQDVVLAAYEKSVKDLAAFKALTKKEGLT